MPEKMIALFFATFFSVMHIFNFVNFCGFQMYLVFVSNLVSLHLLECRRGGGELFLQHISSRGGLLLFGWETYRLEGFTE